MDKLRVGIIGFGRIGNEHAAWLRQCKFATPVAVMDATPARRAIADAQGLGISNDLFNDVNIDAILIATPTALHHEHALATLKAGKHVMIEKPMALNLAEAEEIVEKSRRQKKLVSVFHNRRWDIDYLTVKSAVQSGKFGKVINIESRLGQWGSCVGPAAKEWRPEWRNEKKFGGGGLYDWGSHFIDQIWRMMWPAKPTRVFAQMRGNIWTQDCDDITRVCIDFDNGAIGLVEINTTTTRPLPRWHIDGTAGSAESPFSSEYDLNRWAEVTFTPAQGASEILPVDRNVLDPVEIWDQFATACAGNEKPAVAVESVLGTMRLMDAARESATLGKAITDLEMFEWTL